LPPRKEPVQRILYYNDLDEEVRILNSSALRGAFSIGVNMKEIIINNKYGEFRYQVDDEDYEYLLRWSWFVKDNMKPYAKASKRNGDPKEWPKKISLHRIILMRYDNLNGFDVDHIDHNIFNNQKSNLRKCTERENAVNSSIQKNKKSTKYKGVNKTKQGKYYVQLKYNGHTFYLGVYDNEIFAAKVYDQAARFFNESFAGLNFPDTNEKVIDLSKYLEKEKYQHVKEKVKKSLPPKKKKVIDIKGVNFLPARGKWRAYIKTNKFRLHIGSFDTERNAKIAKDQIVKRLSLAYEPLFYPESNEIVLSEMDIDIVLNRIKYR
jgi:uncharacterized protein YozE (UPF0346 family)